MMACDACCPLPRMCQQCRHVTCTPLGAMLSNVASEKPHDKCEKITLPPEPTPDKLREWISEVKERVRNAFSYDPDYALAWISETERVGPCRYPVLDSRFTTAIRDCVKTKAVGDKMHRLTAHDATAGDSRKADLEAATRPSADWG